MSILPIWFVKTNLKEFREFIFDEGAKFSLVLGKVGIYSIESLDEDDYERLLGEEFYLFDSFIIPDETFRYYSDEGYMTDEDSIRQFFGEVPFLQIFNNEVDKCKNRSLSEVLKFPYDIFSLEFYKRRFWRNPSPNLYLIFDLKMTDEDVDVKYIGIL